MPEKLRSKKPRRVPTSPNLTPRIATTKTPNTRARPATDSTTRPQKSSRQGSSKTPKATEPEAVGTPGIMLLRLLPLIALLLMIFLLDPGLPFRAFTSLVNALRGEQTSTPIFSDPETIYIVEGAEDLPSISELPPPNWELTISPVYTREIQYWGDAISLWSSTYRIQPNLIATLMQIESCGNPQALSSANAQGLFQVLPLHFTEADGDHFDPATNAHRGLLFFGELLAQANGDYTLAFVGYNGGPSRMFLPPDQWPQETRDYQFWASGIFEEAELGLDSSPTLDAWLNAGGRSLCNQAAEEIGLN
ncbi:MAG: transglycosylase SLT domain-containing protein [Chloroflexi bacterium]|nr:transglycosylase SLT domain-containing protein [Chloroflexota bacterium]